MFKYLVLFVGLSCLMPSCKTPKNADSSTASNTTKGEIISITHGTSFGMCRGYCIHEEEYSEKGIVKSDKSWDTVRNPEKVENLKFTEKEFTVLTNALKAGKWNELEEVIGCPDCADRGSEYIIVKSKGGTKKVTFDAYTEVPEIADLLKLLRDKKKEMEPKENMETE